MRKIILLTSVLAALSACKTPAPVAPLNREPHALSIAPGVIIINTDTLAGMLAAANLVTENPGGTHSPSGPSWTTYYTAAVFWDTSQTNLKANDVELNGISIPLQSDNWYYTSSAQTFGTSMHWQVTANDSGTVPSIDTTISAPNIFHVTSPVPIVDTVSVGVGFTCTYGNPGTDSVNIYITYDSVATEALVDTSNHTPEPTPVETVVPNTGSFTVSGAMLSGFPTSGLLRVFITAYKWEEVTVSGKKYLVAAVSRARTYCFLKP